MKDIGFLLFFIPLALLLIFSIVFWKKRKGSMLVSDTHWISKLPASSLAFLNPLPFLFKIIALSLVIWALARPQQVNERSEQNVKGIDIMIVLDISLSMLVEDMGQGMTRLQSAKEVVHDFIQERISDRVGLIVFSGESYTRVPLTLDYNLLSQNLSEVEATDQIKPGTAIGVALANAAARLRYASENPVIIFLTDGENNRGSVDPLTALKIIQDKKIRVYTIGMGSVSGEAPIKYFVKGPFGRKRVQTLRVQTHINKKLMRQMAESTDGKFFIAKDLVNLRGIFSEIDRLEKQDIKTSEWTEYKEEFSDYLKWGLLFYGASLFLSLTFFFRGV